MDEDRSFIIDILGAGAADWYLKCSTWLFLGSFFSVWICFRIHYLPWNVKVFFTRYCEIQCCLETLWSLASHINSVSPLDLIFPLKYRSAGKIIASLLIICINTLFSYELYYHKCSRHHIFHHILLWNKNKSQQNKTLYLEHLLYEIQYTG